MTQLNDLLAKVRHTHGKSAPVFLLGEALVRELDARNEQPGASIAAVPERELLAMSLRELRTAEGLTQVEVAKRLDSTQGAISQLEQREDSLLSSLRAYLQATGGELELVVTFDDGRKPVRISQFDQVREKLQATSG